MLPAEVLAVFSEPQVYEDWMGGNLDDALLFQGLRLRFDFTTLNSIAIHHRADAYLFDRPIGDWTKEAVLRELEARGYDAHADPNGDVDVPGRLGFSFEADGRLVWVEVPGDVKCLPSTSPTARPGGVRAAVADTKPAWPSFMFSTSGTGRGGLAW